jgi:hypothetical protein
VPVWKASRPAAVITGRGPHEVDLASRQISSVATKSDCEWQAVHAELIGPNRCVAEGVSARGAAPVLALCRLLVRAGHDPRRPLHAYRDGVQALVVRSIGAGALVTVDDDRHGRPRLRRWRDRDVGCGAGPPIRQNCSAASDPGLIQLVLAERGGGA